MLFDATLRNELGRSFSATLVVILTIVLTSFLIRTVGQAASGAVSPQDVVLLLGYITLGYLPTIIALSMFVAIVLTLGRMYRDSEMAIWFASGVGLVRFVRPVLRAGMPVLLVVAALLLVVWPWANRASLELRERYQQRSDLSRVTPGVFQASSDGRRVFFVEREGGSPEAGIAGAQARNVFVLTQTDRGEAVTSARAGRIDSSAEGRELVLERGQRNELDTRSGERTLSSFESYRVRVEERDLRAADNRPPRATGTIALLRNPTPRHQGELVWRLGLLLATGNLLLLGVGLAATNPRRASNWNLLFALLAFVVYYNLVNLSQAWVAGGRLGMGVALGVVHGGGFVAALALLWWRENGAVSALWRRRVAGPASAGAAP